ncbi:biotin carboxylase N-terminal domain-containing protein [Streptomyces sp. NPDC046261]|uniref:acetyl/propionyl/methylcrotonyl-CoA carboxylase subunit alpha n=1 Tax=Streptomyces sp. NPDC046261 TaxID=3157200 RepID=UPI0033D51BBE
MFSSAKETAISSVLVANRGEIACRVFRTCRELGVTTVAVYSDPDAGARHVREADAAVRLPGGAAADTYLRGDLLIAAARAAGADAVHPGYGFLSENAGFARAVREAGLVWIGPPPEAIEAMASKTRAKRVMARAGVPLLAPLDPAAVTAADLPVLVKAAAGGGGRGMRVVRELAGLDEALASARAEAVGAFGDGDVFVEPYLQGARHVEVQLLADAHGTVWTLGTRDCSLQRRHQKVIEEAPAPGLPEQVVLGLCDAATSAARAIGYLGAGTAEFLVVDGRSYFLEMNTRLQVEHPVTEAVYGVDLVALQLRVAEGAALGSPPPASGHAVEARLYAEDPARDWLPQTGVVHRLAVGAEASWGRRRDLRGGGPGPYIYGPGTRRPSPTPSLGPQIHDSVPDPHPSGPVASRPYDRAGLRVDSGFSDGDLVGVHYDPLLAKVVVWAPTRLEAVRQLAFVLERARIHGPVTNRDLLVRSLRHPEFARGAPDTGFYSRHLAALTVPAEGAPLAALAAAVADAQGRHRFGGWRNVFSMPQIKSYRCAAGGLHTVRYRLGRDGLEAEGFPGVRLLHAGRDQVVLEVDGVRRAVEVASYGGDVVYVDTPHAGSYALTPLSRFPDPAGPADPGSLLAPMPGTVVRVADGVAVGASVRAGQALLWLEAMKMEHRVVAPASGTLSALHAVPGAQVLVGELLAVIVEFEETVS